MIESDLRRRLREEAPGGTLPPGAAARVAVEVGVTRARAYQLAARMGLKTVPRDQRPKRRRPAPPRYLCLCGRQVPSPQLCPACDTIVLPCSVCGRPIDRRSAEWVKRLSRSLTGRIYCGHSCSGSDMGARYGWGEYRRRRRGGQEDS